MAWGTNVGLDFSFPIVSTFASNQFKLAVCNGSGQATLAAAAAGEAFIGVIQDNPATGSSEIRTGGVSKVKAGGTFAAGDLLASDASGQAVKYTKATVFTGTPYVVSGSLVVGVALAAGASGQISQMLVSPRGLSS